MKKRILCSVLVATTALGGIAYSAPSDEISSLKQQVEQNNNKKATLSQEVSSLNGQLDKATEELMVLQTELNTVNAEVENTKAELEIAEKKYGERKESLNSRVSTMYKNGSSNYMEVVLGSEDIKDFFTRVDMVKNLVDHDNKIIEEIKEEKQTIEVKEDELELKLGIAKENKEKSEIKKNELIEVSKTKADLVKQLEAENNNLASKIGELEAVTKTVETPETVTRSNVDRAMQSRGIEQQAAEKAQATPVESGVGNSVVSIAYQYLGIPYVYGGNGPNSFDCSGLTSYVYRQVGVSLPRIASAQQNFGTRISLSEIQAGDLVFWGSPAYHVGIYIGGGKYLHSPRTGDVVKISTLSGASSATRVL